MARRQRCARARSKLDRERDTYGAVYEAVQTGEGAVLLDNV